MLQALQKNEEAYMQVMAGMFWFALQVAGESTLVLAAWLSDAAAPLL